MHLKYMMMEFIRLAYNDLSFLNEVRNECAAEYLHDSRTFTLEETINWYKNANPDFWIIWYNNERVGYFRTSNYSKINKNIYVGADLHKDFRGRGLAYESYCKFIPFLFNKLDLHKISLEVLSTNQRAINLYDKIGFRTEGIKRDEVYKNGVWVDSIIMSILENEYDKNV
jgi:RimJ/RimL family protein N-acetyltransferase